MLVAAAVIPAGCKAWLDDPRPMGETEARDMYSSEEGFRNVLTGVYINMSESRLYGRNMSMVLPEMFAQNWNVENMTMEYAARNFNFEDASLRNAIASAWSGYYNCIINLNSLLDNIDDNRSLFSEANFNLIKGEALGLRAFLHMEALKMWGPVPADADLSKTAIPYVKHVSKNPKELISIPYGKVLEEIITDLDAAELLLADDPITMFSRRVLTSPGGANTIAVGDDFYFFRQSRFNLYAVKAAKARYYMWAGQNAEAKQYAVEVIEATVADADERVFTLCNDAYMDANSTERTLTPEHIFAVYKYNLLSVARELYRANGRLQQTGDNVARLYEDNLDEIRWKPGRYWENVVASNGNSYLVFKKYIMPDGVTASTVVPLIRLPEMYMIATECSAVPAFDVEEVRLWFEPYRIARNIPSAFTSQMTDAATVHARLEKEYRKEFFGEGLMFHYYKRLGVTSYTWPLNLTVDQAVYVIPKPEGQIIFE